MTEPILKVKDLQKLFPIQGGGLFNRVVGNVRAVDGLNLEVFPGETLGLVGESGCGKSTAGRAMLRLIEPTAGSIEFNGQDITNLKKKDLVPLRREMQMIFQDPFSSLNPRHTIGDIIGAPFRVQGVKPEGGIMKAVQGLMDRVGLNPEHYNRYPNEFSGGQRQRIGIARAIALKPKLIVCDEPVSALDVSIQAQIINLMKDLQKDFGLTFVFIAHDLAVVRHFAQRVAVMYLGNIVEITDRDSLYSNPKHPYTKALLSAVPEADPDAVGARERIRLTGDVPNPINPPSGCRFRTRCWKAQEVCATTPPQLLQVGKSSVACHFPE